MRLELHSVEPDAGAHCGGENEALDICSLCRSGLGINDSVHESVEVFNELILAETYLADGAVADVGLIDTIFNLTGFNIGDCLGNIHGDGSALGVRHQALRTKNTTDTTDNAHHIGGSYADIESKPVLGLDLLDHILIAYEISACFECFTSLITLCKDENANGLAGTVGENHCAAALLLTATEGNAQKDMGHQGSEVL